MLQGIEQKDLQMDKCSLMYKNRQQIFDLTDSIGMSYMNLDNAKFNLKCHCKIYIDVQEIIVGMPMNRNEAVSYLKDLLSQGTGMSPDSVSFEQTADADSEGYAIHIKGRIENSEKQTVRIVAQKHNFQVKDNSDGIIVYKP
jgi:hypothetical protein